MTLLHAQEKLVPDSYVSVLRENCLLTMQNLLSSTQTLFQIPSELKEDVEKVLQATSKEISHVAEHIKKLSTHHIIQEIYSHRGPCKIQIPCVSHYYWENVERIASPEFLPTVEDILHSRAKTSGVQTINFVIEKVHFEVVDVGGQRAERRKWLHCFDNVTAVLFLAAIDEYDMVLEEDENINRFDESLRLWSEISGSQYFKPLTWILFLNKSDSLQQKIQKQSLHTYFEDISEEDGKDFEKSTTYFSKKYEENFNGTALFYYHITCAINTDQCQKVFSAVRDTIILTAIDDVDFT
uniref:Uncharacterized protein n=1 Tax=Arcella intermedia TaxID=1963864 RepID=A0A6B2L9J7_9EUKA